MFLCRHSGDGSLAVNSNPSKLVVVGYLAEWALKVWGTTLKIGISHSRRVGRTHRWALGDEVENCLGNERREEKTIKLVASYVLFLASLILTFCQNLNKCWEVIGTVLQWLPPSFPLSSAFNLLFFLSR